MVSGSEYAPRVAGEEGLQPAMMAAAGRNVASHAALLATTDSSASDHTSSAGPSRPLSARRTEDPRASASAFSSCASSPSSSSDSSSLAPAAPIPCSFTGAGRVATVAHTACSSATRTPYAPSSPPLSLPSAASCCCSHRRRRSRQRAPARRQRRLWAWVDRFRSIDS